ncbi:hypothetical protein [Vibrio phage vB_VmeM-Yong XC32]|nr:hypothetical protein [Vibrio phage vB_VmeM-Yong XC31]QAX96410.1 hypothetical protein [Vibrio phage vB_VmeM-Yong XC32]QAX96727.1 hypothetical protein [Vibrio phage vB_VmeM-Yong MS31]QAX97046.1 hypothetical protein [Vibrio phage vB_VmeM-Yong MS32]
MQKEILTKDDFKAVLDIVDESSVITVRFAKYGVEVPFIYAKGANEIWQKGDCGIEGIPFDIGLLDNWDELKIAITIHEDENTNPLSNYEEVPKTLGALALLRVWYLTGNPVYRLSDDNNLVPIGLEAVHLDLEEDFYYVTGMFGAESVHLYVKKNRIQWVLDSDVTAVEAQNHYRTVGTHTAKEIYEALHVANGDFLLSELETLNSGVVSLIDPLEEPTVPSSHWFPWTTWHVLGSRSGDVSCIPSVMNISLVEVYGSICKKCNIDFAGVLEACPIKPTKS